MLARLWQERAARQATFRTTQGRRIQVLYPGRRGTEAGPDFRDALLYQEDLGLVRGDVELHLRQEEWRSHGHHKDPGYNGVVLHGVLQGKWKPTRLHSGASAPVVSLEALLRQPGPPHSSTSQEGSVLWSLLKKSGFNPPEDRRHAAELLDQVGQARFLDKSRAFDTLMNEEGAEEVLYQGIMESLGYSENRQAFLELAHGAPYRVLQGLARPAPREDRRNLVSRRLLEAAGLLQVDHKGPIKGARMSSDRWRMFRVRPSNHPRRRITGAACLLSRHLEQGLLQGLADLVRGESWRGLEKGLAVSSPDSGPALIGKGRAGDMAVNVVLPFFHAWASHGGQRRLPALALAVYKSYPRLQANRLTQEMERSLFPAQWMPLSTTAQRQQGLLHLRHLLAGGS